MLLREADEATDRPRSSEAVIADMRREPQTRSPGLAGRGGGRAPRVLMLCGLFTLPYRVMRCVQAAGADVIVMGNHGARGFRYSRFCHGFVATDISFDGHFGAAMATAVNAVVTKYEIDMVLAGDQPATRSLAGLRPALRAPCFPMPDLATFDLLNDKWRFTQLCLELGVRCPPTLLFDNAAALRAALAAGTVKLPLIAKPLSLDGNRGVVPLIGPDIEAQLATVDYSPVLIQSFIEGVDIGASAYCEGGTIRAFVLHRLARATYRTFANDVVFDAITRIARATNYDGVCNFDMRLAPDGTVLFLECNPRFFYKMNLSMLAGVNFAAYGFDRTLPPNICSGTAVRLQKAFLAALPTPWRLTRRDFAMLTHLYSDPISYIRENLGIDWEDRSY